MPETCKKLTTKAWEQRQYDANWAKIYLNAMLLERFVNGDTQRAQHYETLYASFAAKLGIDVYDGQGAT